MRVKYVWVVLLFILLFLSCGEDESAIKVDLTIKEQAAFKEDSFVVTYAYLPQYSHRVSYMRHHSLIQYLRKETGLNIKQIFPDTFDQHMKMVGQNKIDISMTDPYPGWVYAARKNLDIKIVEKLNQAFGKLDFNNKNHCEILKAADFIKVIGSGDSDFNSVRKLVDKVGMSLEE